MARVQLTRRYEFAAAHQLVGLRTGHKCGTMHGHNYAVEVTLEAVAALDKGMVLDAENVDICIKPVLARIDHKTLNGLALGLDAGVAMAAQPTVENIALFLWAALQFMSNSGKTVMRRLRVYENDRLWAEVME